MAPLMDRQNVTEAELNALRNKFQLLEGDRKAYYEMSMHTMKSNKTLMAQNVARRRASAKPGAKLQPDLSVLPPD